MNFLYRFFASSRTMGTLFAVFAISMALATFIENDFGTSSAHTAVYSAWWFELIMVLSVFSLAASIFKYKSYKKGKRAIMLFHLSFILIILGAACTRYIGFEGSMHIREGEVSNQVTTQKTYLNFKVEDKNGSSNHSFPVLFSQISRNSFKKTISHSDQKITIKLDAFIPNATKTIIAEAGYAPLVELVSLGAQGRVSLFLEENSYHEIAGQKIVFRKSLDKSLHDQVQIFIQDGMLKFHAPYDVIRTQMSDQSTEVLKADSSHFFMPMSLHDFKSLPVVLKSFVPSGYIAVRTSTDEENLPDALQLSIEHKDKMEKVTVWGRSLTIGNPTSKELAGLKITANYGANIVNLPFSIKLNDFILDRYPGSDSPSGYESHVRLIDKQEGIERDQRIYMNNILKHQGYRFYQASYDMDEKGTILSVNYDWLGTAVSYLGYLLMGLGMLFSLFSSKSRFVSILKSLANKPLALIFMILIALPNEIFGNDENTLVEIPKEHTDQFSRLIVQDNGGRFKPIYTLSSEVLRKVHRSNSFKGQDPVQVFLGMMAYPHHWQNQEMIRVGHDGIREIIGIDSKYASFNDFFETKTSFGYKLRSHVEQAYQKKPAYRSKLDNEIIRVDERVNILYLCYSYSLLKIFPNPEDKTQKWYSPVTARGNFNASDTVFTNTIIKAYMAEIQKANQTGEWKLAEDYLSGLFKFQEKYGSDLMLSINRVNIEIRYHEWDIFPKASKYLLLLGTVLLLFLFFHIFYPQVPVKWPTRILGSLIAIIFVAITYGLILRWYISGYAPWSNGYEVLIFVSWCLLLVGFVLWRIAPIAVPLAAILASLLIHTAHLSWMDPQITNLVPVLKSYWLIIHVAVITKSYAFFGLGALLAAINLLVMFFQTDKNYDRTNHALVLLSKVIEILFTVGLYLLTIGTFLGGIWANESWGRYWGWDAKETWALITIMVYAFILHMRFIPGFRGRVALNIASLFGFGSVVMTYFGVNYYLSGLHSYAAGDPLPIPPVIWYTSGSALVISILAAFNQRKIQRIQDEG